MTAGDGAADDADATETTADDDSDAGAEADHDAVTETIDTIDGDADGTRVGLFVDGPNVLRDQFDVDLDDVREAAAAFGRLGIARLYLDEHATPGLIQAAEARGYEVVITSGDVDVKLAIDASESAIRDEIDVLVIASRDTDFKPVIETAGRNGVRTVAIAPGTHGRSDALRNAANDDVLLGE
ncbi:NYN domain-containing protein [Natronoarchaeum philippinense]|uniref:NYN domain-containing protein n=1 Tax=Natronoarchaeum philippinense TaxID=558529 RepID=UPI0035BF056E